MEGSRSGRAAEGRGRVTLSFCLTVPLGPAYEPRLARTLASIAAQDVPVRVALCDASNDPRVHDVADRYASLIAHRRHGPDGGQSAAINEGWDTVDADVYGWLNADDCLAPGALTRAARAFGADPALGVFYGQSLIADEADRIIGLHPAIKPPTDRLYRDDIVSQPSCFVRAAPLREAGGVRDDLHYVMDWDLWCRLYEAGVPFEMTREVLSLVVWMADTKTASFVGPRLREVDGVLKARVGPLRRAKAAASFARFHLRQYGALAREGVTSYADPWRDAASGTDEVRVPLFHYLEAGVVTVAARAGGDAPVTLRVGDDRATGAGEVAMTLALPAGAAASAVLTGPGLRDRLRTLTISEAD